jgi:hypothetical protein
LEKFANTQFEITEPRSATFGPYSRLGLWKYRLGAAVRFVINFYKSHTTGKSTVYIVGWMVGVFSVMAIVLLSFLYLSVYVFSPKVPHQHQE